MQVVRPLFRTILGLALLSTYPLSAMDQVRPEPSPAMEIASKVLDENVSDRERLKLIRTNPQHAADLLQSLIEDIEPGTDQEKARIPWLWEVAVTAARQNNGETLQRILDIALPTNAETIADWQLAVIGGGLIFELSNHGRDPKKRIEEIIGQDELLKSRWELLVKGAKQIALDQQAAGGIRYDSFRVFAMSDWKRVRQTCEQIFSQRNKVDSNEQDVRLAAITALADAPQSDVAEFLFNRFPMFNRKERETACRILLRSEENTRRLLGCIQQGRIVRNEIPKPIVSRLLKHASGEIRRNAKKCLKVGFR